MAAMLVPQKRSPTWRLHTKHCNSVVKNATKATISIERSFLFYNLLIFWFCSCKQTNFVTLMKTTNLLNYYFEFFSNRMLLGFFLFCFLNSSLIISISNPNLAGLARQTAQGDEIWDLKIGGCDVIDRKHDHVEAGAPFKNFRFNLLLSTLLYWTLDKSYLSLSKNPSQKSITFPSRFL